MIHTRGSISHQVQYSEVFFIKFYFRILNYSQSMSYIISLIFVIALQLHKLFECITNRRLPIVVMNLLFWGYYSSLKKDILKQTNSEHRKTKRTTEHILKI